MAACCEPVRPAVVARVEVVQAIMAQGERNGSSCDRHRAIPPRPDAPMMWTCGAMLLRLARRTNRKEEAQGARAVSRAVRPPDRAPGPAEAPDQSAWRWRWGHLQGNGPI
jgi:hypothetical protein